MVQVNNYNESAEEAAWGMLDGRSIPKFDKFAVETPPGSKNYLDLPPGTSYTGVVKELPKQYQANDFESRQPKFYDAAQTQPIMEISIVLDTAYRIEGDDEDDGVRIVRLGAQGKRALQDELRRLGIKRFGIGTQFTMTFTGYGVNKSGGRPPKLYDIKLVPTEYVAAQQLGVEQVLAQAGYTPVAGNPGASAQASFPPAQPVQQPLQQQVIGQPMAAVFAAPAPAQPDPALLALAQAAQAAQAAVVPPVAPQPQSLITQAHVDQVALLMGSNIDRGTAVQAVAQTAAPGNEAFRTALDNSIPF